MFALTLLGLFQLACASGQVNNYDVGELLDFDEDDPFFDSVTKPEEISPMELRRLKHRPPRQLIHGSFTLNPNDEKGMGTDGPTFGNERNLNAVRFVYGKHKEQALSRELALQNLDKVDVSFDTKNPLLGSNKNFLNVIATPYTRSI